MNYFFLQLKSAIPTLTVIFISVFLITLIVRLVVAILIHLAYEHYKKLKKSSNFFKKDVKKIIKEEDELLKNLDNIPIAHSAARAAKLGKSNISQQNNYELITSEEQQKEKEEMSQVSIVDIVKPVGFWTSLILGQKLTYLIQSAQIINKRDKQGFWVSMIEAQDQAAGRQKGRGR